MAEGWLELGVDCVGDSPSEGPCAVSTQVPESEIAADKSAKIETDLAVRLLTLM